MWAEVARAMDMESSQGSALRAQYTKILLPYQEWKESLGEYRIATENDGEDEEDEEEVAARRELEARLLEEKEEKKRKKKERAALLEAEEGGAPRSTRRRGKLEEDPDANSVTFEKEGGVIGVGSKVSVFWDGDGVSYKGIIVKT